MLTHPRIEPKQLTTWTQATSELLHRIFGDDRAAASFGSAGSVDDAAVLDEAGTRPRLEARLGVLGALIERAAGLYEEPAQGETKAEAAPNNRVLVIHARNQEPLESVARFLERIGCDPIVFHEPSDAASRVEKLRELTADVAFAVVLLTGEELGRDKQQPAGAERPRASQSAILELGYLIAALGHKNVCALHYPSVEVPADSSGVVFIPFDDRDGWQPKLVRELEAARVIGDFGKLA